MFVQQRKAFVFKSEIVGQIECGVQAMTKHDTVCFFYDKVILNSY